MYMLILTLGNAVVDISSLEAKGEKPIECS